MGEVRIKKGIASWEGFRIVYWYYRVPGFGAGESMASLVGPLQGVCHCRCYVWPYAVITVFDALCRLRSNRTVATSVESICTTTLWRKKFSVFDTAFGGVPGGCGGTEVTEADRADAREITMPAANYCAQGPNIPRPRLISHPVLCSSF